MIEPIDVVQDVRERRRGSEVPVRFYWVTVTPLTKPSGRSAFAAELKQLASAEAVCPVILRVVRFTHPDTVMNDLADTLEEIRDQVLATGMKELVQTTGSLDVVLVSHKRFDLAVTTSPLHLPEWFPVAPGQLVNASLTDLTLRVAVPLSHLDTGEMCRLLFDLDRALLTRIRSGLKVDPQLVNSFLDQAWERSRGASSYGELLDDVEEKLADVKNPRDYRPSTAKNPTVVGRLWRMANVKSADSLVKVAKSLARATQVDLATVASSREALLTVLARPSQRFASPESRWAFNLIASVQGACQLITAVAHADDYGRYPAWLLRSLSLDLRRSLDDAVRVLAR